MGDYCELHAVKLPDAELVRTARAEGAEMRRSTWPRPSCHACVA
jgi:hypothetical protein